MKLECHAMFAVLLLTSPLTMFQVETGAIVGQIRSVDGTPAAGIRVAAIEAAFANRETPGAPVLFPISQTDDSGRYRLEGIGAGRYHITAGLVDLPTYYPGVVDVARATPVTVTAGATLSNVDFVLRPLPIRLKPGQYTFKADSQVVSKNLIQLMRNAEISTGEFGIRADEIEVDVPSGQMTARGNVRAVGRFSPVNLGPGDLVLDLSNPDRSLFVLGELELAKGDYAAARRLFLAVMEHFPRRTGYSAQAKYAHAESFYREQTQESLIQAQTQFREFITFYPNSPQLDEAQKRLLAIEQALGQRR